jgi:pimeloyl-ACP methyl ester carboxylesterase
MKSRALSLELAHLRVAAEAWGPENGPPVLALHGWMDNAASFERLAPHLDGLRLVALDLPGHGLSDHGPPGRVQHFVDWAPVVLETADALGWSSFSILGHSMGAGIATLIPAIAPERVDRLVLLEGFGPMTKPAEEAPLQLADAIRSETELKENSSRLFPSIEAAVAARKAGSDLDGASAEILVKRGTEAVEGAIRFIHDPRLKTRSRLRLTENQLLAFMEKIHCPVLLIYAQGGFRYPEGVLSRRLEAVKDLHVAEVEGGHHVHLSHPERVAPLILDFFAL